MLYDGMKVLERGEDYLIVQTNEGPATLRGVDFSKIVYESLGEAQTYKEREIRDAADRWYSVNVRPFEGSIVVHQSATGATMTQAEKDIRAAMQANYLTLRDLVGRVRAATTPEEAVAVEWVEPQPMQIAAFSAALGEAEEVITSVRKRRRDRQGRIGNLEERVADLEAELEARMRIFEV